MAEKFTVTKTIGNDVEILAKFETLQAAIEYAEGLKMPITSGSLAIYGEPFGNKRRFYGTYNKY